MSLLWWNRAGAAATGRRCPGQILGLVGLLVILYIISLAAGFAFTQLMAIITQGCLAKLREKMFNGMQNLPIKYFDTHNHRRVMSYYTNDTYPRQMIPKCFPQLMISGITVLTVFGIMLYYSVWMTLAVVLGVVFMVLVTKKVGGSSAKYFIRQQQSLWPAPKALSRKCERPEW